LFFKIALPNTISGADRIEELFQRYQTVSLEATILFVPLAHPMEYNFETLRRLSQMKATKVKNAYMKKKDPLFVRESLLHAAFELAATKGMADVTVNKVSKLADVTKGAFFHHFDSKETLVTELMQMLLTRLDKQFDRLMAEEENSDGCFTRAYIRAAFSEGAAERKSWGALLSLMASKDQVGRVWNNWLSERLKRHSKTDSRIELRVVRLAADGVWVERIMNAKSKNLKGLEEYLTEMTRIR
jgi:AcrR family transcriptional regulator